MSRPKHDRSPGRPAVLAPERRLRWKARALGLALAAAWASLAGCKIALVSGPAEVEVGDTVAYVLEIRPTSGLSFPFFVVADVPEGWRLESSTYVGTAGGAPISGNGLVVQSDACDVLMAKRPGTRRWHIQNPTLPPEVTSSDSAEVTLEFVVESQPEGEFTLYFMLAGLDCSAPEVFTVNRRAGARFLSFVQQLVDGAGGVDGLGGPVEVGSGPDGRHVYVAGSVDRSIGVFAREAAGGTLSFVEAETGGLDDALLGPPRGLTLSPDGLNVYVPRSSSEFSGNTSGLLIFARNPTAGTLTFFERVIEDVGNVVVSPDGLNLYAEAEDTGIVSFSRDPLTGRLGFLGTMPFEGRLEPSPDGRHLYVASSNLHVFERDAMTGALSLLDSSAPGVSSPVMSPDGRHLYGRSSFSTVSSPVTPPHGRQPCPESRSMFRSSSASAPRNPASRRDERCPNSSSSRGLSANVSAASKRSVTSRSRSSGAESTR